jgi:hypothetical protein
VIASVSARGTIFSAIAESVTSENANWRLSALQRLPPLVRLPPQRLLATRETTLNSMMRKSRGRSQSTILMILMSPSTAIVIAGAMGKWWLVIMSFVRESGFIWGVRN